MGHRLVLLVADWSADVNVTDGVPQSVVFRAHLDSLEVESGSGGVTPLTVVDKQVIRRNASKALEVETHPVVEFTSSTMAMAQESIEVAGSLTIHGRTQDLSATLAIQGDRVVATIPVVQSDFGVRPYSAMLGQLKVNDEVQIELDVALPA